MNEELQPIREPLTPKEVRVRYEVLKKDLNFRRLQKKLLNVIWGNMPESFECKDGFHLGDYSKNAEQIMKSVEDELRTYLKTYYPDLFYPNIWKYRKESLPKPPEVKGLPKGKRAHETWEEYYLRCGFDLKHLEQKLKYGKIIRRTREYTPTWAEYCEKRGKDPNDLGLRKRLLCIKAIREDDDSSNAQGTTESNGSGDSNA